MQWRHRKHYGKQAAPFPKNAAYIIDLDEGEKAVVARAFGGNRLVRRLTEMGLTPGVEIKVVRKCPFHGPVELEVRGATLALGYGVASKILVKSSKGQVDG